ncbi:hypothetical protein M409DRAFT_54155 [Zasmidium cellare ATCC 36951]|uniref:Uncharacterized protein n=1 Tax=Zasmidium cellare ATCC 36951 TaxID=1080233 RepID=A0A6A6CN46_ZASCE|nr:uncharacterized protein M409DRAFT_54155 [Zasmidium cellare ATCC 36951]KAF2167560.1 hypothetical protein M409DRAFT_54155 [Zasmidium cellare ATCC 36951]
MKLVTSSALGLAALSALIEQATAVNTWEVAFWQSISCTSEGVGTQSGPSSPKAGSVCKNIPDPGYTASLNFLVGQNQGYSYYLELYEGDNCGGSDLGTYDGNPGGTICIETGSRAHSYKVTTKKGTKRDVESTSISYAIDSESDIQARGITTALDSPQKRATYSLGWLQLGVGSTAAWVYMAAGKCPATAKEEDVNKTQCGLAATYAVIAGFFTVFQIQGLLRHGAPDARRIKGRMPADIDEILGLPKANHTLVDGLNVTMSTLEPHMDEAGELWHYYSWNALELDSGKTLQATVRLHPDGRSQTVSAAEDADQNVSKRDTTNAYYSWVNGNKANFNSASHGTSAVKQATASIWNYGKSKNVAEHCVNFEDYNTSPTKYIDHGSFAIVAGTFTDQSGTC